VARALWFLALFSAFFVVAVRCLSGSVPSSASASAVPGVEVRSSSDDESAQAAAIDLDDDTDDSADPLPALAASAPGRLVTFTDTKGTRLGCGALVAQRASSSHRASLERPPRV
jgi:hypothetical protein